MSIFNRPRLRTPGLSDGVTPPPATPTPTHGRAWHELHDMCHNLGVNLDHEHIEALTVSDFMRLAYAGGFKACEVRLSSPDVADAIAVAIEHPGKVVTEPGHLVGNGKLQWQVAAVQRAAVYGVPK